MNEIIVIPQDITRPGKDFLQDKGYKLIIGEGKLDIESMKEIVAPAVGILARTEPYPAEVLACAPKLKVIARHGVGVDNVDVDWCTKHGIWVTYAPTSNAISVAEHTIALMLGISHEIVAMDKAVRAGLWDRRNTSNPVEVMGKTLGVVGMGRIGSAVARMALAFDMKVLGYDAFLAPDKFPTGVQAASVDEIFTTADFVTVHVPSLPETKGMVNAKRLAMMKKTAYLINCARGDIVVEKDLSEALKGNVIAGAAIDVVDPEPVRADNPLLGLDNLIITPHSAALTKEAKDRMGLHAAMGIHSVLSGEKPQWHFNSL